MDQKFPTSRRNFLAGLASGVTVSSVPLAAFPSATPSRQALIIYLHGGLSQFESWDPKPGSSTGGPFRAIDTSVKGIKISELLPHTAKQMHHLSIIRSLQSLSLNHSRGLVNMATGRSPNLGSGYPHIGSVLAHFLKVKGSKLPSYIECYKGGGVSPRTQQAFLGTDAAPLMIKDSKVTGAFARPKDVTKEVAKRRNDIRRQLDSIFFEDHKSAEAESYQFSYEMASAMIANKDIFDLSKESSNDRERYGEHAFGKNCLLARRLLTSGIPVVQIAHSNFDTHNENFNYHVQLMRDFDRSFANLIADLHDSGLLSRTNVFVFSEMGRTPRINSKLGRDHWRAAWSVVLGGAGIKKGMVLGQTDPKGQRILKDKVGPGDIFKTVLAANGIDPEQYYKIKGHIVPVGDPAASKIKKILA